MFRFLRSLHIVFQRVALACFPTSSVQGVPVSPHPGYSNGVRWNLSVLLICISFMARDGEHFFMCFFAIWISSFEKVLFSSVAQFLIGSLI
jgi:hypothetical protein